jgi:hypothetical protein
MGASAHTTQNSVAPDDAAVAVIDDECYRCGYVLRGIADDQPCPECGLLAGRSRHVTDELHNTRPGWLRRLSLGVWTLLLAVAVTVGWPFVLILMQFLKVRWQGPPGTALWRLMPSLGIALAALLLPMGVWLLTGREGYAPADRADRRLRLALRVAAFLPVLAILITLAETDLVGSGSSWMIDATGQSRLADVPVFLLSLFGLTLPLMLALRLRGLARRARSAHLAEHCVIVGVGVTCAVVYALACNYLFDHARELGLGENWAGRSTTALALLTVFGTAAVLFLLWSLYLLIRFAIAFGRASLKLRRAWLREDRSVVAVAPG